MNRSMHVLIISILTLISSSAAFASVHKGISFQGVIKLPNGEYPSRSGILVNARILSLNNCILREEEFTGVNISNGYINLVLGSGAVGGHDPGLSMTQIMNNSTLFSPVVCLNLDGSINGAVTTFNPLLTNGVRKFRLSLTIDSVPIVADFNMRAVAYAINSETLNGKNDSDFINTNENKNLTQANMESIFQRFTKLDALLNNTDSSGNHLGLNISGTGNVGIGTSTPAASFVVNKTAPTGTISSTGTAVSGSGTNFTAAFSVGDQIVVGGQTKTITAITDANNLTVDSSFTSDLAASTSYTRVGTIFNSGNVGIGTDTPTYALDIAGGLRATGASDIGNGALQYNPTGYAGVFPLVAIGKNTPTSFYMNAQDTGSFQIRRIGSAFGTAIRFGSAWGTLAAPVPSTTNQSLGGIMFEAYTGGPISNGYNTGASIGASASAAASLTNSSANLFFSTTPQGSTTQSTRMRINDSGNVAIGNLSPSAHFVVSKTAPTGTISSAGTAVTGVGTNFTAAFSVGDQIVVGGQTKTITAITDATNLTVNTAFSSDLAASTVYGRVGTILNSGNVGIGTTTPTAALTVRGNIQAGATATSGPRGIADFVDGDTYIRDDGGNNFWKFSSVGTAGKLGPEIRIYKFGWNDSRFFLDADTNYLLRYSSNFQVDGKFQTLGAVGIGTTSPTSKLHVVGGSGETVGYFSDGAQSCSITPATAGNISCSSDERLKQDIQPFADSKSLENILKLETVTYEWKSVANGRHTGYIAQEVEKVAPEFVLTGKDGYKQVSYTGLIPWITGAIKELYYKVMSQGAELASKADQSDLNAANIRIKKLESENTELRIRLENIEKALLAPKNSSN